MKKSSKLLPIIEDIKTKYIGHIIRGELMRLIMEGKYKENYQLIDVKILGLKISDNGLVANQ